MAFSGAFPPVFRVTTLKRETISFFEVTKKLYYPVRTKFPNSLCSLLPYPVTGGSISVNKGRLDFDMPEQTIDKEKLIVALNRLISENHCVETQWNHEPEL